MKPWYIASAVAIVYLTVSFALQAWSWSWIIRVGYGLYRFLENRKSHDSRDLSLDSPPWGGPMMNAEERRLAAC